MTSFERLNDATIIGVLDDEILARPIRIARGQNKKDMRFVTTEATVGALVASLTQFGRGPKDGQCILQGALVAGQRIAKNVSHNYTLMFDYDTGLTIEEVGTEISERGLMAVLWTTHSHLKPETTIPEDALVGWLKRAGKWQGHVGNVTDQDAIDYLLQEKRIKPDILEGARITNRAIQEGGMLFTVAHKPLPRLRAMFFLKDVFDFANRNGTQKDAVDEWKARYASGSDEMGLPSDAACVDPSHLMYTPRIPHDAVIGQGAHEIIVFAGKLFDFDALEVPETVRSGGGARNPFTEAAANAGAGRSGGTETDFATPGLKKHLAQHGHDFQAADFYAAHDSDIRFSTHNGNDHSCPRGEHHTKMDDGKARDFMVRNAEPGGAGWVMYCLHDGCQQASGKDRAWYLDYILQKLGLGVEDLVEFSTSAVEARAKQEKAQQSEEAAKKFSDDDAALIAAIDALTKETPSTDVDAILSALGARPDDIETTRLVERVAKKIGVAKIEVKAQVKAFRKAHKEARAKAAEDAKKRKASEDDFGFGDEGPVSRKRPVPRNKASAEIIWLDWDRDDVKDCALARLQFLNKQKPEIFMQTDGTIVRLREFDGQIHVVEMPPATWLATLYDAMQFRVVDNEGLEQGVAPPSDISMYVSSSKYATYPFLEQVVHVPVFTPEGKLHTKPGYDEALRVYLKPDLDFYPLPAPITDEDVDTALDLLLYNALRDFPFSDAFDGNELAPVKVLETDPDGFPLPNFDRGPSSRANALALILQQFCRSMIKGPTPAYHLDKASPGTGANYLADVVAMILEGTRCTPTPMAKENDEVRKTITSLLREAPNIAFFDNINRKVTSEAIAAALTTGVWKDRILGVSETTGKIPIRCAWIFAGNNLQFSHELYRRNVPIRMDAACPNPALTRGPADFKHFPLHDWLATNRRELVWACHVLIGWWVQHGMPRSSMVFNSFDEYAAVMGGILESVGVKDFGVNIPHYLQSKDDDTNEADLFVAQIYEKTVANKVETFTSKELYAMLKNDVTQVWEGALELSGNNEQAQLTSLGMALSRDLLGKTFDITSGDGNVTRVKLIKINKSSPTKYLLVNTSNMEQTPR